jgi:hypothetical protein
MLKFSFTSLADCRRSLFFPRRFFTKTFPNCWQNWNNTQLFNRYENYNQLYDIFKKEINEKSTSLNQWSVIYVSGLSKIGKTTFGLNTPSKLLEISKERNEKDIENLLNHHIYLLLDGFGGDAYNELYDTTLKEKYCLGWRLLSRACGFQQGVRELREIFLGKNDEIKDLHMYATYKGLDACKNLKKF